MKTSTRNLWAVERFPVPVTDDPGELLHAALVPVEADLVALPANEVRTSPGDIEKMVAIVLAAVPRLQKFRARIALEVPDFDWKRFERLTDYAKALRQSHAFFFQRSCLPVALRGTTWKATRLRRRMQRTFDMLVERGQVRKSDLSSGGRCVGYGQLVFDLSELPFILGQMEEALGYSMAATEAEAKRLSAALRSIYDWRAQSWNNLMVAYTARDRSFTLMWLAYSDARRAIQRVRQAYGDADQLAPPLHDREPELQKSP